MKLITQGLTEELRRKRLSAFKALSWSLSETVLTWSLIHIALQIFLPFCVSAGSG
jgi:hypothetical protein